MTAIDPAQPHQPEIFQHASIAPDTVLAGDSVEFVIRIVVGNDFTSGPARLLFDFSAMLGTSCPTLDVNEASGYVELYVDNPSVTWEKRIWDFQKQTLVSREHPASREAARMVVVTLSRGIVAGNVIELHWGETTRGFGPGTKVSTVVPRQEHYGRVDIRYFDDPNAGLPDSGRDYPGCPRPCPRALCRLRYRILPREPARLKMIRQLHRALLLPLDRFWNIAGGADFSDLARATSQAVGCPDGRFEFQDSKVQVETRGLPLADHAHMGDVFEGMNIYWGDIHCHSSISNDCKARSRMDMMPADLMHFARERAGLDFFAVTDHHIPAGGAARKLAPESWEAIIQAAESFNEAGRFVAFPAFELSNPRGDVVFILKQPLPYAAINQEWQDVREAWEALRNYDYISIPHFHDPGQIPEGTWWRNPDDRNEPVIEILSDHGSYEREDVYEQCRAACKAFRWDRCGSYFLKNGYRYGFVGNSDDHKGHVGVNGLTAVYARSLDRQSLLEAYRSRRVYATSNARIRLLFTANGQLMGSVLRQAVVKEFHIAVAGEGALKKVELFRNGDLYHRFLADGYEFGECLRVSEPGPDNWYVRVTQIDNQVAISSPIWFE